MELTNEMMLAQMKQLYMELAKSQSERVRLNIKANLLTMEIKRLRRELDLLK